MLLTVIASINDYCYKTKVSVSKKLLGCICRKVNFLVIYQLEVSKNKIIAVASK